MTKPKSRPSEGQIQVLRYYERHGSPRHKSFAKAALAELGSSNVKKGKKR